MAIFFETAASTPPIAISLEVLWSVKNVCSLSGIFLSLAQQHTEKNWHLQLKISNKVLSA